MNYYLIYKSSLIFLFFILLVFPTAAASTITDNYLWLELGSSFSKNNDIVNREINIYFGHLPDEKKDLQGLYNVVAFYTIGKKDNQGREIFYSLEIKKKEARNYVSLNPDTFNWCKVIVTAREERDEKEYNYCAMVSAFIPGDISQSSLRVDKPIPGADFAETFDVSIYRERIKEELSIYRKRLFPVRMKIKLNRVPFSNRPIKIIDMYGDRQQITTARNGDLVYFPKDRSDNRLNSENKFNADLILMQDAIDSKIYICVYTISFSDAITKKRNFSLQLGLIIFMLSFTVSFFLLHRKCLRA